MRTFTKAVTKTTALLMTSALLYSGASFAHSSHNNSCDVDLAADIKVSPTSIALFEGKQLIYRIDNDEQLWIDGENVNLNAKQQALVTQFSSSIRATIPEIKQVALDGVDLAIDGVNLAFNELLGEGNSVGAELVGELSELKLELSEKFSSQTSFTIDQQGQVIEDFLGENFEQRIEGVVEDTIEKSMGTLLIAVGKELLSSGSDMDSFESRMENFGERIEHEMEMRAGKIEQRAEGLCQMVVDIDELESEMSANIEPLAETNLIKVTKHNS